MVGQDRLLQDIRGMIQTETFPRFCIITGERGSGKKTLAKNISKMFGNCIFSVAGIGIDDVRSVILQAYRLSGTQTLYLLPDADNMSVQAKNALLKVTEEPPNNAFFLMTLQDANNTLDTIRSRAVVFSMQPYTQTDILQYVDTTHPELAQVRDIVGEICETPGEVDELSVLDVDQFYQFVQKVVQNIAEVSTANALKISTQLCMKDGDTGYDLAMFWKAFLRICVDVGELYWVKNTSKKLSQLKKVRGINRQMLFDSWVLELRGEV